MNDINERIMDILTEHDFSFVISRCELIMEAIKVEFIQFKSHNIHVWKVGNNHQYIQSLVENYSEQYDEAVRFCLEYFEKFPHLKSRPEYGKSYDFALYNRKVFH
jgi:hypothetical protein